jgi:hypothetical protein
MEMARQQGIINGILRKYNMALEFESIDTPYTDIPSAVESYPKQTALS